MLSVASTVPCERLELAAHGGDAHVADLESDVGVGGVDVVGAGLNRFCGEWLTCEVLWLSRYLSLQLIAYTIWLTCQTSAHRRRLAAASPPGLRRRGGRPAAAPSGNAAGSAGLGGAGRARAGDWRARKAAEKHGQLLELDRGEVGQKQPFDAGHVRAAGLAESRIARRRSVARRRYAHRSGRRRARSAPARRGRRSAA